MAHSVFGSFFRPARLQRRFERPLFGGLKNRRWSEAQLAPFPARRRRAGNVYWTEKIYYKTLD